MEELKSYLSGSYRIRILLGALFAAVVADGVITEFLVHNGLALEANPFLRVWIGRDAFLAFKVLGGLLASLYLYMLYRRRPRLSFYCSFCCLAAYTTIIFWNLHILF